MMSKLLPVLLMLTLGACVGDDPEREFSRPDTGDETDSGSADATATADAGETPDDMGSMQNNNNPVTDTGGGGEDTGTDDMGMTGDAGTNNNNGVCRPNRDGTIERDELDFVVGASAKFMIAQDVTFDTAGTMDNGVRTWDLSTDFTGEYLDVLQFRDPTGEWWETEYPDADYFTPLSASSDLLGVFQATEDQLLLLGVVSPEDGFFATDLSYDPPVPVLSFPLTEGKTWSVETAVSGTFDGVVSVYDEVYDFEVDADGALITDFGNFQVLRVRTTLDRQVGFVNTIFRSFAFVTECFGTIATIAAEEDETEVEFTQVSELKRIAP